MIYAEDYIDVIKENGYNTKKNITVGGTANVDLSGSTGTFKFPSGAVSGSKAAVISGQGATKTLAASDSGSTCLFDRAAGIVYTLPAPAVGLTFEFIVITTITSNAAKIITDAGTTLLQGSLLSIDTDSSNATVGFVGNASTHISVSMNGTTTGGILGTRLRFTCVSATLWNVSGEVQGSGVVATPFATS